MRENRTYGSEGGGAGNSTGSSYPYHALAPIGAVWACPPALITKTSSSPFAALELSLVDYISRLGPHHFLNTSGYCSDRRIETYSTNSFCQSAWILVFALYVFPNTSKPHQKKDEHLGKRPFPSSGRWRARSLTPFLKGSFPPWQGGTKVRCAKRNRGLLWSEEDWR